MTTRTTAAQKAAQAADPGPLGDELPDSGTSAPPDVWTAWSHVMGTVQGIGKGDRNEALKFSFRGIDAVMNAVGPALREHGVSVIPTGVEILSSEWVSGSGKPTHYVIIQVNWRITGPAGDYLYGSSLGEAGDWGDKAVSKAHSVAYRTFLLQALCIPTDDPDPDLQNYTRDASVADQARAEAGETLSFEGKAGYDRLKEIAKIPDQSDRIKAVAEWTTRAEEKGVAGEKVLHGGRLRTLASIASELASNSSQTLGDTP